MLILSWQKAKVQMCFLGTGYPNNSKVVGYNKRDCGLVFQTKKMMGVVVHYVRPQRIKLTARWKRPPGSSEYPLWYNCQSSEIIDRFNFPKNCSHDIIFARILVFFRTETVD